MFHNELHYIKAPSRSVLKVPKMK